MGLVVGMESPDIVAAVRHAASHSERVDMLRVVAALARIVVYAAVPCWPGIGVAKLRAREPCKMTSHRAPTEDEIRFVARSHSSSRPAILAAG